MSIRCPWQKPLDNDVPDTPDDIVVHGPGGRGLRSGALMRGGPTYPDNDTTDGPLRIIVYRIKRLARSISAVARRLPKIIKGRR